MLATMDVSNHGNEPLESLSSEDFGFFKDLVFAQAGISLSAKKLDLVQSRLRSHIQKRGMKSFAEYRNLLQKAQPNDPEMQNFINLLTTNKTDFFREPQHFDYLTQVLIPAWVEDGRKEINVWCCASSTGEEPYTLAMVLNHYLPKDISYKILATDVEIYNKVSFQRHNLIEKTGPNKQFDLIFCRNVLIYFEPSTIRTLMGKLHHFVKQDGMLFIGHSESIQGSGSLFKTIKT